MMPETGGLNAQDEQFLMDLNTWLHVKAVVNWNRDHPEDPVGDYIMPPNIGFSPDEIAG